MGWTCCWSLQLLPCEHCCWSYPLYTTLLYPLSMLESTTPTTPSPPLLSVVLEFLLCTPTFTLVSTTCTASVRLRLSLTSTPTPTTTLESATSDTTTLL